jgi:phosphate-selective porin
VDLDSGEVRGGRFTSTTVGVNWYLSSFVDLRFNYAFALVSGRPPGGLVLLTESSLAQNRV